MPHSKAALSALALLAIALAWLLLGNRSPVRVTVDVAGTRAIISVDGESHEVEWKTPTTRLQVMRLPPLLREYQIDGSDTTSNGTLDLQYLERIKDSAYYRFQSWLRDEASYNRWTNFTLYDDTTGTVIGHGKSITEAESLVFPARFSFSADLYRDEKNASLIFVDEQRQGYLLGIYRDSHAIEVIRWANGPAEIQQHWFYPRQAAPFAAMLVDTLAHVAAWGLALLAAIVLLYLLLSPLPRLRVPAQARSLGRLLMPWGVLAVSFAFVTYITLEKYNALPHIYDSESIFLQSKILATGRLFLPPPPSNGLFDYPFMVLKDGRYFSQYAPGTAMTLAVFRVALADLAWLSGPLLSVATLAGIVALARRMYDWRVAALALVLAAFSPFYNFMAGTMMTHPYSLFYLTFFLLFLVRYYQSGSARAAVVSGALLGAAIITRESSAAFFAGPWLLFLWGAGLWRRRRQALVPLLGFALATLAVGSIYLWYNWQLTGQPLLTPRAVFDAKDRYGFGPWGWHGIHTLAAGLVNTDEQVTSLLIHLFGWPFYLTLAPAIIPFISGRCKRWDVLNAVVALAFILGYAGYFYHGIVYGPRYYYEALPFFIMLTARGFVVAGEVAAGVWRRLYTRLKRRSPYVMPSPSAPYAVLAALLACNVFYYTPRQMEIYNGFSGGGKKPDVETIYNTRLQNAVIMTSDGGVYRDVLSSLNCPDFLTCDPVWVLVRSPEDLALVRKLYPDRQLYELKHPDRRPATFVPLP